ncbi:DUF6316 family protein [Ketobacter sp.]|uniref:DUF6316 family protein n=1 Tax=Ketobacter sp. TaxID=2083498 RepID=UPI0025BC9197|nr:DUF6316 family protein [Ketobacter sp.]|tara:strand:- start:1171 stop:1389 length:219 start_codon:yes stop_codon:yes gene_type:complete
MSDSPDHRKTDSKAVPLFRTHRIHSINSEWYFLTREGQNIGPFPTRKDAEENLLEFLKSIKKINAMTKRGVK